MNGELIRIKIERIGVQDLVSVREIKLRIRTGSFRNLLIYRVIELTKE